MNLLVLKFLTMNTDDERREFTREVQRNRSLRFSSADLLNIVNGNTLCELEPEDLEDLRKENSFILCFPSRTSLGAYLQSKISWSWCNRTPARNRRTSLTDSLSKKESAFNQQELVVFNRTNASDLANSANNLNMITSCDSTTGSTKDAASYDKKKAELAMYLQQRRESNREHSSNRRSVKAFACPSCFGKKSKGLTTSNFISNASNNNNNGKSTPIELDNNLFSIKSGSGLKKKSHYTIVRAPGEISHLLRAKIGKSLAAEGQDPGNYTSSISEVASAQMSPTKPKKAEKNVTGSTAKTNAQQPPSVKAKKSDESSEEKVNALEVSVFIDEDTEIESAVTLPPASRDDKPAAIETTKPATHLSPQNSRASFQSSQKLVKESPAKSSPSLSLKLAKNRRSVDLKNDTNAEQESLLAKNSTVPDEPLTKKLTPSVVIDHLSLPNDTEIIIEAEEEDDNNEEDLASYKVVEV